MRIWHVGASRSPNDVNGVNYVIWSIAKAQARLDHTVTLLLEDEPDEAARNTARYFGFELRRIPVSMFRYDAAKINCLLTSEPPQMVHFHSVFIPQQATLARLLERRLIPFVVTPHGGLSPHILGRGRWKKSIYSRFVEAPRLMRSAAISIVLPKEEDEVRNFVPEYRLPVRFVPNPVDDELFDCQPRRRASGRRKIVYLGRFDVEHKGIDRLIEIARFVPQADFHLYGAEDKKSRRELDELKQRRTCNVHFHDPVYGARKLAVLEDADLYVQTSRWEAFGIAVAEAMAVGVPCAVAGSMHIAGIVRREQTGIVLPDDPKRAAGEILKLLRDPERRTDCSTRARQYAAENFTARGIAAKYVDVYREVIQSARRAEWQERVFTKTRQDQPAAALNLTSDQNRK